MALNLLTNAEGDLAIDALFPSAARVRTATASSGTGPITLTFGDTAGIVIGSVCTGSSLTGTWLVTGVTQTQVTIAGGAGTAGSTAVYTFTATYSASLHTGSPGQNCANEVSGGSYARQGATLAYPSSTHGTEPTTNAQNWTNMPSATVTYFGMNTATSGTTNYLGGGQLGSSLTVPVGATVAAAIGALTVAITA